jgi:ATP-dependent helicase Lhr and Lhr-like helicase
MGAVFPDQIACAENLPGEREIPDHPLVRQAICDSLTEAMDIEGLERLLQGIESGAVRVIARDLTQPSLLALEVLSARPYAYLDDASLEERRTQAMMARRWISPQDAADLGRLDPEAVARVRSEAWPEPKMPMNCTMSSCDSAF